MDRTITSSHRTSFQQKKVHAVVNQPFASNQSGRRACTVWQRQRTSVPHGYRTNDDVDKSVKHTRSVFLRSDGASHQHGPKHETRGLHFSKTRQGEPQKKRSIGRSRDRSQGCIGSDAFFRRQRKNELARFTYYGTFSFLLCR